MYPPRALWRWFSEAMIRWLLLVSSDHLFVLAMSCNCLSTEYHGHDPIPESIRRHFRVSSDPGVMPTTVPGKRCRNCSSQSTDSARWLVGSSKCSMSGFDSSKRHSATRRFSLPDRTPMMASQGGKRRASAAISSCSSRLPPSEVKMIASRRPCSVACASKSASGST